MKTRSLLLIVLAMVALLAFSACIAPPPETPEEQAAAAATAVQEMEGHLSLVGTSWRLESVGAAENSLMALPEIPSTLNFFIIRYGGFGGCNWYLGVYDVDGSALRMNMPTQTRNLCEPVGIMDQEGTFMSALLNTTAFAMEGEKLVTYTAGDQRMATFVPAETAPLEGTLWNLGLLFQGDRLWSLEFRTSINATIEGDTISGSAGCNDFSAGVTYDESSMTISMPAVTMMECSEPRGVMEQEAAFLEALAGVASYQLVGNTLMLLDGEDQPLLVFGARLVAE